MKDLDSRFLFFTFAIFSLLLFILFYPLSLTQEESVKGTVTVSFETQPNISIEPELNISRFAPYIISASEVSGDPLSVSLELWGKNGNVPSDVCWDYYVDGTCSSENITKEMTYSSGVWSSPNIYPDSIYPEIYFTTSEITWGNAPLSTIIRRNQYHLMHFNNPFQMVNDMYFYIELNAYPVNSSSSADLQVYLVSQETDISNFNESWFEKENVQLVGTFSKDTVYHHTHSENSKHILIPLSTNANGNLGSKGLNVNGDFWIVLYSDAANNNRGWNLQYQPSSLCNYENRWYQGNNQGWSTTVQQGCPDAHIHIARRNADYMDGIQAVLTAEYGTQQAVSEPVSFYFGQLPNLPPIATSFTSPQVGGTYSQSLEISWDPSSDPNNDPIYYNIYLKQQDTVIDSFLNILSTSVSIPDTTSLTDGNYTVVGEVCDDYNPCVQFSLGGEFTVSNTLPVQTISSISLSSSNSSSLYAKEGDTVILEFTTTGAISTPVVDIYSGGDELNGQISSLNENLTWTYTYVINQEDTEGQITFVISSTTLAREYFESTDGSNVIVDLTPPLKPQSSLESGTYPSTSTHQLELSSEGSSIIRYTVSNENINCDNGLEYTSVMTISSDTALKVVACDQAGNISQESIFEYYIKEDLLSISLSSSNMNEGWAKKGDTISLSFVSSGTISSVFVDMYIKGDQIVGLPTIVNTQSNDWNLEYIIDQGDSDGDITYRIYSMDLYKDFIATTDETSILVDKTPPLSPTSLPLPGVYSTAQLVSLSSLGHVYIRYVLDGTQPSCLNGLLYLYPIAVNKTVTIKAVACDEAGNQSVVNELIYLWEDKYLHNLEQNEEIEEVSEQEGSTIPLEQDTVQQDSLESEVEIVVQEQQIQESINEEEIQEVVLQKKIVEDEKYEVPIIRRGNKIFVGEFKIKVVNANQEPLPNAILTLFSEPKQRLTNNNGIAIFHNVEIGQHVLEVKYNGMTIEKDIGIDLEIEEDNPDRVVLDIVTVVVGEQSSKKVNFSTYLYILLLGILISFVVYSRVKSLE